MGLIDDLGRGRTAIDTSVFIYFIEASAGFLPLIKPLFQQADTGMRELVTSALTLLEVLVVPYRAGDVLLAERYEKLLTRSRGIRVIDVTTDQLRDAARLRAATGIKTPDALQLAAAIATGCTAFITNERRIPSVSATRVLQLTDYV